MRTQREIRRAFWEQNPRLPRRRLKCGNELDYPTDTRVAFVDFIDHLCRNGQISSELAQRAEL